MSTLLLLVLSSAFAKDSIAIPTVGANQVLSDCTMKVVASPWTTGNAGRLVIDQARAQAICIDAKSDAAVALTRAQAEVRRSDAQAQLVDAAAIPVMNGQAVNYVGPDGTRLATGSAADWSAYGQAVVSADPAMRYGGYGNYRGGDPNLWRLSGAQMGGFVTPVMPGVSAVAPTVETAPCGTPVECQKKLDAAVSMLDK